ncbi:hypothetical protein KC19_3G085100 [Ceratodon purpureus]|uniref:Uncharacterized protein n=1 Tax=Ceratodon purpureus TaxID=3225 RepID=A0A8T0IG76_CERPU|nr:hypothetical protein KC19_3G085100 [Ceratodon purpureus]
MSEKPPLPSLSCPTHRAPDPKPLENLFRRHGKSRHARLLLGLLVLRELRFRSNLICRKLRFQNGLRLHTSKALSPRFPLSTLSLHQSRLHAIRHRRWHLSSASFPRFSHHRRRGRSRRRSTILRAIIKPRSSHLPLLRLRYLQVGTKPLRPPPLLLNIRHHRRHRSPRPVLLPNLPDLQFHILLLLNMLPFLQPLRGTLRMHGLHLRILLLHGLHLEPSTYPPILQSKPQSSNANTNRKHIKLNRLSAVAHSNAFHRRA